jgi:hypothetical protein
MSNLTSNKFNLSELPFWVFMGLITLSFTGSVLYLAYAILFE